MTFAEEHNQYVTLGHLASPETREFVDDDENDSCVYKGDDLRTGLLAPPGGSVKRSSRYTIYFCAYNMFLGTYNIFLEI